MSVVVTERAWGEIRTAHAWYRNLSTETARAFLAEFRALSNRLSEFPLSAPIVDADIRRATLQRFPYHVFYVVDGTNAVIIAVVHARQSPSGWPRPGLN